jgi:hypothetical protein
LDRSLADVKPIYLDYNATTPLDPTVVDAMLPYLHTHFGNPSSAHVYGKVAHEAVEKARAQVAALLGAQPDEIVFTGGGTEASNHALKGAVFARLQGGSPPCDADGFFVTDKKSPIAGMNGTLLANSRVSTIPYPRSCGGPWRELFAAVNAARYSFTLKELHHESVSNPGTFSGGPGLCGQKGA